MLVVPLALALAAPFAVGLGCKGQTCCRIEGVRVEICWFGIKALFVHDGFASGTPGTAADIQFRLATDSSGVEINAPPHSGWVRVSG